jgi:hypothetical protein
MQKKYITGFIWLFTLGLFGIGWAIDALIALVNIGKPPKQQQQKNNINTTKDTIKVMVEKKLVKSFDTVIVGTFAKSAKYPDEQREDLISIVKPNWELYLEHWTYKGDPAYYVCHPNGTDLGCVRAGLAKILYEDYSDCEFKATAIERTMDDRGECLTYKIRIDIYR